MASAQSHSKNGRFQKPVFIRTSRARGEQGLAYVEHFASRPGGEVYAEALPVVRKAITDAALTRRIKATEGVDDLINFLAWNGDWWPSELLGSQVQEHGVIPECVRVAEALKRAAAEEKHARYQPQRKYDDLAASFARQIGWEATLCITGVSQGIEHIKKSACKVRG